MAAPFQWSLAALETLMAEDQMDQHAAVLRAFSVVELWRLRRVCRAFHRWGTAALAAMPRGVVVQGAPPQALLLLPLRRQHQVSSRGLENDWTATLRGAGHAESGHQPSKGSAQRAEPPGARSAKARARLLRGATRTRGAGAARAALRQVVELRGGSCDAACLPDAAAAPYLVATVCGLGVSRSRRPARVWKVGKLSTRRVYLVRVSDVTVSR